jgi:hypothetical protein
MNATFRRRAFRVLVPLAALAAAAVAAAGAAADLIPYYVDGDTVSTLGSGDFKFHQGTVGWWYDNGTISAHLKGEMKVKNADGACVRMRLEYFNDSKSLKVKYGGTMCPPDGKTHRYTVDMNPWANPNIDLLKVTLQKETAKGWTWIESGYFKPNMSEDTIRVSSKGIDFGDNRWGVGSPIGSGTLDWQQGEGMDTTPRLRGYLHLDGVAGLCARVKMVYESQEDRTGNHGTFTYLATRYSGRACAPDKKHYSAHIDIAPFTSNQIYSVEVALQSQGTDGTWRDIPSKYWGAAYIDEGH